MKDAPEVSWHVKFDSQNLKHSGDLARWSTIIAPHESSIEPKHNLATLGISRAINPANILSLMSLLHVVNLPLAFSIPVVGTF